MWKHASPFTPSLNIRQHLCFWAAKKMFFCSTFPSRRVLLFLCLCNMSGQKPSWRFPGLLPMHQMNVGYIFSDALVHSSKNAAPTVSGLLGGLRDKPLGYWFSHTYAASADCCHAGLGCGEHISACTYMSSGATYRKGRGTTMKCEWKHLCSVFVLPRCSSYKARIWGMVVVVGWGVTGVWMDLPIFHLQRWR